MSPYTHNKNLVKITTQYYNKYYKKLTPKWRKLIFDVLSEKKAQEKLAALEKAYESSLKGTSILEIGSGFGVFVAYANQNGCKCYGIEPDKYAYSASQLLLKENKIASSKIVQGHGEKIPFKGNRFDIVVSFMVLEHVQNIEMVIKEASRVLKPTGMIYFVAPNYKSFWDGHYGLPWLPLLPKSLARLYVTLLGRDISMVNEINYITPKLIRSHFSTHSLVIKSMGKEVWVERIKKNEVPQWGQTSLLSKIVTIIHKTKLTSFVIWIGSKLELYYPIIVVAHKLRKL